MKRNRKTLGIMAVVADLTLLLSGCVTGVVDLDDDDWDHSGNYEASADFSETVGAASRTALHVLGGNGKVEIWGIPGTTEITIDAVRRVRSSSQADAARHLDDLQVLVNVNYDDVVVKTLPPDHSHGRTYIVDYEITVPPHLVSRVANGNGQVRIEGMSTDIHVENGNGDVALVDVLGSSWVTVGNGQISTWAFLPDDGRIVNAVGNGSIFLEVQPQVSATFDAKVGNGSISLCDLDLQQMMSTPRQLRGVFGEGDGTIDLALGNGQIHVQGG